MGDEKLRQLERAALLGDPEAQAKLRRERKRLEPPEIHEGTIAHVSSNVFGHLKIHVDCPTLPSSIRSKKLSMRSLETLKFSFEKVEDLVGRKIILEVTKDIIYIVEVKKDG